MKLRGFCFKSYTTLQSKLKPVSTDLKVILSQLKPKKRMQMQFLPQTWVLRTFSSNHTTHTELDLKDNIKCVTFFFFFHFKMSLFELKEEPIQISVTANNLSMLFCYIWLSHIHYNIYALSQNVYIWKMLLSCHPPTINN